MTLSRFLDLYGLQMLMVGSFLLALITNWLFVHLRFPWWFSLPAGLLFIAAFWFIVVAFNFPHPSPEDYRRNSYAYEWLGLGYMVFTGMVVIMAAVYAVVVVILNVLYRKIVGGGVLHTSRPPYQPKQTAGSLFILLVTPLLGSGLAIAVSDPPLAITVGSAIGFLAGWGLVLYRDRLFVRQNVTELPQ